MTRAMFWIHGTKQLSNEITSGDVVLRRYSGYWNAFECLVDAALILHPMTKVSKSEKQRKIDEYLLDRKGKVTVQDIEMCYRTIVDPGFINKAQYALQELFSGEDAQRYITECFKTKNRNNSLYDIRNSINHGDVDPSDPFEAAGIQQAAGRLHTIVWRLFGKIMHFDTPDDRNGKFGIPLDEYTFEHPNG